MKIDQNIIKTLIFTILVPGTATILIPYYLLTLQNNNFSYDIGILKLIGIPLIIIGVLFYLSCALNFATIGKGTPAPIDPPKEFVSRGLYKYVRNPMYISALTILFGEFILFQSFILLFYAIIFWCIFHTFVIFYEEPTLKKKFGEKYINYLNKVPRWLFKIRQ